MAGRGTGTPYWFKCAIERREPRSWSFPGEPSRHVVRLTGRTKPNRSNNVNVRVSRAIREYECSCGHVGWSNHIDLERLAERSGVEHSP